MAAHDIVEKNNSQTKKKRSMNFVISLLKNQDKSDPESIKQHMDDILYFLKEYVSMYIHQIKMRIAITDYSRKTFINTFIKYMLHAKLWDLTNQALIYDEVYNAPYYSNDFFKSDDFHLIIDYPFDLFLTIHRFGPDFLSFNNQNQMINAIYMMKPEAFNHVFHIIEEKRFIKQTIIQACVIRKWYNILNIILSFRGDPNFAPSGTDEPIVIALKNQDITAATILINHGAILNFCRHDKCFHSLTHFANIDAAYRVEKFNYPGRPSCVLKNPMFYFLLQIPGNINYQCVKTGSNFFYETMLNDISEIIMYITMICDVDINFFHPKTNMSPLMVAFNNNNLEVFKFLLDNNASLYLRNFNGINMIMYYQQKMDLHLFNPEFHNLIIPEIQFEQDINVESSE